MLQSNDLSRSFTALNQDNTLIVVIEMGLSSWLVAGMVPGPTAEAHEPMAS
jgi:transposase